MGIADLLTAVLEAQHGMTVVHYDADFEIAAECSISSTHGFATWKRLAESSLGVRQLVSEGRHATYAHGFAGEALGDRFRAAWQRGL